jgi:hypothetical protein
MGVPSWSCGSRSWSINETLLLEGTSWEHQADEADGRLRHPQLIGSPLRM